MDVIIVGPWMLTVDLQMLHGYPWMLCGKDEVQVDIIMVDPWRLWGTDEVWVHIVMVLARGCSGERMRSG